MTDRVTHEITVIARDAQGHEDRVEAEYRSQSADVIGAANEVLEATAKEHGRATVRVVDASR